MFEEGWCRRSVPEADVLALTLVVVVSRGRVWPGVPGTVIGDALVATSKVAIPDRLGLHIEQMTSSTGPGRDVTNCAPTIPVVGPQ